MKRGEEKRGKGGFLLLLLSSHTLLPLQPEFLDSTLPEKKRNKDIF